MGYGSATGCGQPRTITPAASPVDSSLTAYVADFVAGTLPGCAIRSQRPSPTFEGFTRTLIDVSGARINLRHVGSGQRCCRCTATRAA
jgi:hypothetical protein